MAIPTTQEELSAFIIATMEEHNPSSVGPLPPMPQPPGMGDARDIVTMAEGALEMLRQREQAMATSEQEAKDALSRTASLVQTFDERLEEALR